MGTTTLPLAAFKVAIRCGRTTLTRLETVGIHGQTHGTTRITPFKTGIQKDFVQAFFFGLSLDQTGPGHHHGLLDVGGHTLAANDRSGFTDVFNARVGARTNEHAIRTNGQHHFG